MGSKFTRKTLNINVTHTRKTSEIHTLAFSFIQCPCVNQHEDNGRMFGFKIYDRYVLKKSYVPFMTSLTCSMFADDTLLYIYNRFHTDVVRQSSWHRTILATTSTQIHFLHGCDKSSCQERRFVQRKNKSSTISRVGVLQRLRIKCKSVGFRCGSQIK